MAITKKMLKNNRRLSDSVGRTKDVLTGQRALVLKTSLSGLNDIAVKDFYNVVILESDSGLASVKIPDFLILQDHTPYRNHLFFYDSHYDNPNTTFVTNFNSVKIIKKLNRSLNMFNLNYFPGANGSIGENPSTVEATETGLDADAPGVHLALIMGCTSISYTGSSSQAKTVTLADIITFTTDVKIGNPYYPKNLISRDRKTLLRTTF